MNTAMNVLNRRYNTLLLTLLVCGGMTLGCGQADVIDPGSLVDNGGAGVKQDSGWIGADSYEVNAVVRGTVRARTMGEWADLENDEALQAQLVDSQLKFIKNTAESHGWRFNQLAQSVEITSRRVDADGVTLEYAAIVDMLGVLRGSVPTLEEIDTRLFSARVPMAPEELAYTDIQNCAKTDDSHSVAAYNFHYYFAPEAEDCELELSSAALEITQVFDRPRVYPEYDQLLQPLEDGTWGFAAALVPNRGDHDPLSRFDAHAKMLESALGLTGVDAPDGTHRRYTWKQDDVTILIDLYNPTNRPWEGDFASNFRQHLSQYTLVHYNGHSSYGTKHLLDDPEAYSEAYQILMIHSCQSYAYYTRQAFRAKATPEDPDGFAGADIVATGRSSYPAGSPPTLEVLLQALMDGMTAIRRGQPEYAPDWITIAEDMKGATWGDILYGIAGVRTNAWQPGRTE